MTKLSLLLSRRSGSTPIFRSVRKLLKQTGLTSYGKVLQTKLPKGRNTLGTVGRQQIQAKNTKISEFVLHQKIGTNQTSGEQNLPYTISNRSKN